MKIPSRDATPPTAGLEAIARDTSFSLGMGGDPELLALKPDDSVILNAVGEDRDGGIKDLSLAGVAMVKCKDPTTGRIHSRRTGFLRRHVAGAVPSRIASRRKTSRFVLRPSDFAALCPGGGIAGVSGQASVRALNFHGGQASSPRLEFLLADAEAAAMASRIPPAVVQAIPYPTGSGTATGSGSMGGSGVSGSAAVCYRTEAPSAQEAAGPLPAEASAYLAGTCEEYPVPFVSPGPSEQDRNPTNPNIQSPAPPRKPPI